MNANKACVARLNNVLPVNHSGQHMENGEQNQLHFFHSFKKKMHLCRLWPSNNGDVRLKL